MEDMLRQGLVDINRVAKTMKSHMSLENLVEFLKANDLSKVQELYLLHLSDDNSNIDIIKNEIRKVYTGSLIVAGGDYSGETTESRSRLFSIGCRYRPG